MRPPGVIRWVAEKLLPRADLVKPRTASFRSPNEFVRPFPPKRLLNIGDLEFELLRVTASLEDGTAEDYQ
jgi:hypothetical protein